MRRNEDMFDISVRTSGQLVSPRLASMMVVSKRTLISEGPPIREGQLAAGQMRAIHGAAMQDLPVLFIFTHLDLGRTLHRLLKRTRHVVPVRWGLACDSL